MSYSLAFLTSSEAASGRAVRRASYEASTADILDTLSHVLHIETGGQYVEFDCESADHAAATAQRVVDTWSDVASVAIRQVKPDGSLSKAIRILDGYMDRTDAESV